MEITSLQWEIWQNKINDIRNFGKRRQSRANQGGKNTVVSYFSPVQQRNNILVPSLKNNMARRYFSPVTLDNTRFNIISPKFKQFSPSSETLNFYQAPKFKVFTEDSEVKHPRYWDLEASLNIKVSGFKYPFVCLNQQYYQILKYFCFHIPRFSISNIRLKNSLCNYKKLMHSNV